MILASESQVEEPQGLSPTAQARARRREIDTRPPLTRLVHRQSNALSLYLTAIYVAHLEAKPGRAFNNRRHNTRSKEDVGRSWSLLAGLSAPRDIRSRRARMRRALDELVAAGLVNIRPPGVRYRYEEWLLLKEDGSESHYRVPSERESEAIQLPATFFLNGWHLVLTPGEIAMPLAIMDMARSVGRPSEPGTQQWVALPQSTRRDLYGLTGEIYLHAQQLREFGLVSFHDPMPTRRRGKISTKRMPPPPPADDNTAGGEQEEHKPPSPVPYLFSPPDPAIFGQDAFTVVHTTLSALPIPYRLDDIADLISPQDLVKFYLQGKQSHPRDRPPETCYSGCMMRRVAQYCLSVTDERFNRGSQTRVPPNFALVVRAMRSVLNAQHHVRPARGIRREEWTITTPIKPDQGVGNGIQSPLILLVPTARMPVAQTPI